MSCSFPYLNELGYNFACDAHDDAYNLGTTLWHKIKADFKLSHTQLKVRKWHSPFVSLGTLVVMTFWPDAYLRFYGIR